MKKTDEGEIVPVDVDGNPGPKVQKAYLGDGVYVEPDPYTRGLVLTTENGIRTTNRIVLEPEVLTSFVEYIERMVAMRTRRLKSVFKLSTT